MRRLPGTLLLVASVLAGGACSSISSQLADLRERDSELADEIRVINDERKAVNQLMAALERLRREDSAAAEAEVEKARRALAKAEAAR